MDFNGSTKFDNSVVSKELKEVKDKKMEVSQTFVKMCSSIGAKIEDNVDLLYFHETSSSKEKSIVDGSKFEVKSEWPGGSSKVKLEHGYDSTFVYCDEHLENPKSSVSSCSSISGKNENNVNSLCCDESTLKTEKSLVDATQRESKSECSEESIELEQKQESEGGLAYSAGTSENNSSAVQQKEHGRANSARECFQCEIGGYKSIEKIRLRRHIKSCAGENRFECEICGFKCTRKGNLKIHMSTHTDERPFQCETCGYKCITKSSLKIHILTHTDARPFQCETCGYKCTVKSALKTHMLTHTDEWPFQCEMCGYKCNQLSNLKRHMLTHTEELPFQCEMCGYKCNQLSSLKRHMLTHTDERPFQCEMCGYKSKRKSSLKTHMLTHTDERRFPMCT